MIDLTETIMHCTTCFRPENKCIGSIMRLKEVYYKILGLHFFMIQTRNVLPPGVVLSLGPFCPWEVLSLGTFCPLGRFIPWDVMSMRHFVLGRFVCDSTVRLTHLCPQGAAFGESDFSVCM